MSESSFDHGSLGRAHCRWWHADSPEIAILFIPGNPGLIDFYIPFLDSLVSNSNIQLTVLAHAHLGHSPGFPARNTSLSAQITSAIEAFDALCRLTSRVAIIGHSVGSWIALQVLKARPTAVHNLLLLFPTISNIASTRNGLLLSRFFRPPVPYIISALSRVMNVVPTSLLCRIFPWPQRQIEVLQSLLLSPSSIFACLSMAHQEMLTIRDPDFELLNKHHKQIILYFAEKDDWVSDEKDRILRANVEFQVFHGQQPHAFCISHGEEVATHCAGWLESSLSRYIFS